jgi:hypothetical protein
MGLKGSQKLASTFIYLRLRNVEWRVEVELHTLVTSLQMAVPYLKRLVAGFPPLRSGVRDRVVMWDFAVGKVALG